MSIWKESDPVIFTVPGDVVPQQRPRMATRGRGGRALPFPKMYDPPKCVKYKAKVASCAEEAMDGVKSIEDPVMVEVVVYRKPPAGGRKGDRDACLRGERQVDLRPDLDNAVKSVLDGMNGVVYRDDAQVVKIVAWKEFSEAPRAEVKVRALIRTRNDLGELGEGE